MEKMKPQGSRTHFGPYGELWPASLLSLLPATWSKDVPLVRLSTCGCIPMAIEVLQGFEQPESNQHPIYAPPSDAVWEANASKTTLALLAYLVSQPGCYASQDTLAQALRPGKQEIFSPEDNLEDNFLKRPENVVSQLRHLLYPPVLQYFAERDQRTVRNLLIQRIKASQESGPGYRLASFPLIWLDVEAMERHVRQAVVLEQFGESGMSEWQAASQIGFAGPFLPHEPYSDWAVWRSSPTKDLLWQSVEAQMKALTQEGDPKTDIDAFLRLLRAYWQVDETNEDAFRLLVEQLGKCEHFQQIEDLYRQFCLALEREGREPHERTEHVMTFVRTKMITRKQVSFSRPIVQTRTRPFQEHSHSISSNDMSSPFSFALQTDTSLFERYSVILNKSAIIHETELAFFDQQTRSYWRAREETTLPSISLYTAVLRHLDDLHVLFARSHLPPVRQALCGIVSRTMLLAGMLLYDQGFYEKARSIYQMASRAAMESNALALQAIIWGWMSFTWTYEQSYRKALHTVQYAQTLAHQTSEPFLQAWLAAIEAEIQAHLLNREGCLQALREMDHICDVIPNVEIAYLFEFNTTLLLGYQGVCLQQFYQRDDARTAPFLQRAREALEQALNSESPLKRRLYYMTDLASVYARQGEIEVACSYLTQSLPLLQQIGSGSETVRKHVIAARTLLTPYQHVRLVQDIDTQMLSLFQGERREMIQERAWKA